MSARVRRLLLVTAVLPLVMLVGLRSAWAAYACRIDGEVRAACCCPKQEAGADDGTSRMARACCCDLAENETVASVDARDVERLSADFGAHLVVAPASFTSVSARQLDVRPSFAHHARPPPRQVPIFLVNRSILR